MVSDVRQRKAGAAAAPDQPDTAQPANVAVLRTPAADTADTTGTVAGVFGGRYLKDCVYGGLDGIITTFSVVSGVYGSQLSHGVTLVLGFANLLADGLSMATGNYLGTSAERDLEARERARTAALIRTQPDVQRAAVRAIYVRRGFTGADLERAVAVVTSNPRVWLNELCPDSADADAELDTDAAPQTTPIGAASVTFVSFVAFGLVPLLVYVAALLLPTSWMHAAVSAYAQLAVGAPDAAVDLAEARATASAAAAAASAASAAASSIADAQILDSAAVVALTQALLFRATVALTGATAFALGWLKAHVTGTNALLSGCQTLALSALASGVAWGVGAVLKELCAEFDVVPVISR